MGKRDTDLESENEPKPKENSLGYKQQSIVVAAAAVTVLYIDLCFCCRRCRNVMSLCCITYLCSL